jgi:hypothetical protein
MKKDRKPASGGINKLPRNFLTDGRRAHQLLKSSKDILFSAAPSTTFENFAELRNTLIISRCEFNPGLEASREKILLKIAARTDSISHLKQIASVTYINKQEQ